MKKSGTIKNNVAKYTNNYNYYGDCIKEMTGSNMKSWNCYLNYPYQNNAFFCKSGAGFSNINIGLFAITRSEGGRTSKDGFRVCLI